MKTQSERVLDYLWSVGVDGATNSQIRQETGITSHQVVFMLTQQLASKGLIKGRQFGREWRFYCNELPEELRPASNLPLETDAYRFENQAREVFSKKFGVLLKAARVPDVLKIFDLVSADFSIVGDAKYYTLVAGTRYPPAKFSIITENVWLLEKTGAKTMFLVFGNDREVPIRWLKRYGHLSEKDAFYFMNELGLFEELK